MRKLIDLTWYPFSMTHQIYLFGMKGITVLEREREKKKVIRLFVYGNVFIYIF